MPRVNGFNPDNRAHLSTLSKGPTVSIWQSSTDLVVYDPLTTEQVFGTQAIPANELQSDDIIIISSYWEKYATSGANATASLRLYWSPTPTPSSGVAFANFVTGTYSGVYQFHRRLYIGNGSGLNNQAVGLTSNVSPTTDLFQRAEVPVIYPFNFGATSYIISTATSNTTTSIGWKQTKIQKQ